MTFLQSKCFASYGSADSLNADADTIHQFIGKSSLPAIDTLAAMFLRNRTWTVNKTGSDFTTNTIVAEYQRRNE